MIIVVPVKRVPDAYSQIALGPDGKLDDSDIKWVINPFDEIALEEAVQIRENGIDAEIVVVTIGSDEWQEQLRTALAMGADRGIHIGYDGPTDASLISHLLAKVCLSERPDLVLMGKQAIDDDCNQVGQMLAGRLGWHQATFASKIDIAEGLATIEVTREVDSGNEVIRVRLPAVITVDLRLNEPRYVALPAIIRARSKPIQKVDLSDFRELPRVRVRTIAMESPPARQAGRMVESVAELAEIIKNHA